MSNAIDKALTRRYKSVAKELGVKHLWGRWAINIHPQTLIGRRKLFRIIPLDGWISDPRKVYEAVKDDPIIEKR